MESFNVKRVVFVEKAEGVAIPKYPSSAKPELLKIKSLSRIREETRETFQFSIGGNLLIKGSFSMGFSSDTSLLYRFLRVDSMPHMHHIGILTVERLEMVKHLVGDERVAERVVEEYKGDKDALLLPPTLKRMFGRDSKAVLTPQAIVGKADGFGPR